MHGEYSLRNEDRHFNRASLSVGEPVARVKRRFSVAWGCSARLSWHFRAGAGAKVAARGEGGGGSHEPARRHARASGDGGGYQSMRWSNAKAGGGGNAISGLGS